MSKTTGSILHELTQKVRSTVPKYTDLGSDNITFHFKVSAVGHEALGKGSSKKMAKQNASSNLLKVLEANGKYVPPQPKLSTSTDSPTSNDSPTPTKQIQFALNQLHEFCLKYMLPDPQYEMVERTGLSHLPEYTVKCSVGARVSQFVGHSIKSAKREAAVQMLESLNEEFHDKASEIDNAWLETFNPREIQEKYLVTSIQYKIKSRGVTFTEKCMHMITDIMERKNISAVELWRDVELDGYPDTTSIDKLMKKLELTYTLEVEEAFQGLLGFLIVSTTPPSYFGAFGDKKMDVERQLFNSLIEFLREMSM